MAVGAGGVGIAFKVQSAANTAATGTYTNIKHDTFSETPNYATDEGRPEIGGGLAVASSTAKYGASPFCTGTGKIRLETIGTLLQMAGFTVAGNGASATPAVYSFATSSSTFPYVTGDWLYDTGIQHGIVDLRAADLALRFTPRTAPTFAYRALGGNHLNTSVTHAAASAETVPSPAAAILAANSKFFGTNSYKVYDFSFNVQNLLDNERQPLGQFTPDDVAANFIGHFINAVVPLTENDYLRLMYGSTGATAAGATMATGALNMRVNNGDGTKYIEFAYSAAEYLLGDPVTVQAGQQVLLPIRARNTGTATVTVVNAA